MIKVETNEKVNQSDGERPSADQIIKRILKTSQSKDFKPSGINKNLYLDIIETVVDAYGRHYFERVVSGQEEAVVCIVLRAAGSLAYLLSAGRKLPWYNLWIELMDKSCEMLTQPYENAAEFDLSVQELIIAMKLMGRRVSKEIYERWYSALRAIDPFKLYGCQKKYGWQNNMTVYNMAGEYLRESEGMTDTYLYFKENLPWVLSRFDENGMFDDVDSAMTYDITARCRLALMLHFGYAREGAAQFDDFLKKSGLMTLLMQSSQYQLPFGGRSNQAVFNECLVASCCEYEAARYQKEGNLRLAGMFKRCAHMSAVSILRWLTFGNRPKHYKNFFSDENFGTDSYGTYPRYLIPIASFIGYAYLFSDEQIEECECPCEIGGYVLSTSERFHKVISTCQGNTVELELKANTLYDATGCGRYHKAGVPIELGLSMPFTATPKYHVPESLGRRNLSICTGFKTADGSRIFVSDLNCVDAQVNIQIETHDKTVFSVRFAAPPQLGYPQITETYTLDASGVTVETELLGTNQDEVFLMVPLLKTNGKEQTIVSCQEHCVSVALGQNNFTISTQGDIEIGTDEYGNRNGIYQIATIRKAGNKLSAHLSLR